VLRGTTDSELGGDYGLFPPSSPQSFVELGERAVATSRPETKIQDYRSILDLPHGAHLVVVGGQAVSIWADRYLASEPELRQYLPFTSKDLDLLGDYLDLEHLAKVTGFKKEPAPHKLLIPSAGYLEIPRAGAQPIKVEVLKRIHGVMTAEAKATALVVEQEGIRYRVLHPVILLKAKLEAAIGLPQDKPGQERQDIRHLKIVLLCVRGFLRELIMTVEAGELPSRDCVNLLEETMALAMTRSGIKARKKHGIDWTTVLPITALEHVSSVKLRNFRDKRLPRWQDTLQSAK